jgi:predicted RNA binding protein YcfA (HicA-like mRNA interferase family)
LTIYKWLFIRQITVNSQNIIKLLWADGWYLVHVVGSHHQFKHPSKSGKVTVPHPRKDLPMPTVKSILKQAGLPEN